MPVKILPVKKNSVAFKAFCLAFLFLLNSCSIFKNTDDDSLREPTQSAEQIFQQAEAALAEKNYNTAIKYYESLDASYPFSAYGEKALLDSIYAYYQAGDYASSSAAANRFMRNYPANKHIDYVLYLKSISTMLQDRTWPQRYLPIDLATRDITAEQSAFESFALLVQHFPDSIYAPDAKKRMVYLRNLFAEKNIAVANYYLKKKAYIAAINRASIVLTEYNGTSAEKQALEILIQSYTALGDQVQANKAKIMLRKYFACA